MLPFDLPNRFTKPFIILAVLRRSV